jgi:hypothetical protein
MERVVAHQRSPITLLQECPKAQERVQITLEQKRCN